MTVVVIPSGEKGDRLAGSLDVKAPDGWESPGQIRTGGQATWQAVAECEPVKPRNQPLHEADSQDSRESRAAHLSAKANVGIVNWTDTILDLPGVIADGMSGRSSQRKPGARNHSSAA